MNRIPGRPLEELIDDLASGMLAVGGVDTSKASRAGVRPVSIEVALPMELRVVGTDHLVVRADAPARHTRTAFDRPLGRLSLTLVAEAIS